MHNLVIKKLYKEIKEYLWWIYVSIAFEGKKINKIK